MPKLQVIVASTRPGRVGKPVGEWFVGQAQSHGGFDIEVTDLKELALPLMDEPHHPMLRKYTRPHTISWSETIDSSDAFVFVMPEYNHGFTAPLKNALDFLAHEWAYKPAGFVSYGGVAAGTRAVQMLKPVLTCLKVVPATPQVALPFVHNQIVNGRFQPGEDAHQAAVKMLAELIALQTTLTQMRQPAA